MKKIISTFLFFVLLISFLYPNFFTNLWFLVIDKHFFIPEESSILSFKATKMNDGSGDWWLYAEDSQYYYALNTSEDNPKYFASKKEKKHIHFDKHNFHTW